MIVIIKKGEIVESQILLMKSIDELIDLIHIIEVKCVGLTTIASKDTGVKFDGRLRVRRFVGDAVGTNQERSETCRNFRRSAEEIVGGSQRSPRRLGYSLKSSQDQELAGSPSEEIRGHIGSPPKDRRNKTRRLPIKNLLRIMFLVT